MGRSVTLAYASNDVNEYTSIEDVGAAGNPITVLYDAAGNLSRDDDEYEYAYDYENRLTQIDYAPDGGASTRLAYFAYDALGRMISSQLRFDADVNGRTETLKYSYDGVNVIAEYDESGKLSSRYIHGTQRIDERALMLGTRRMGPGGNTPAMRTESSPVSVEGEPRSPAGARWAAMTGEITRRMPKRTAAHREKIVPVPGARWFSGIRRFMGTASFLRPEGGNSPDYPLDESLGSIDPTTDGSRMQTPQNHQQYSGKARSDQPPPFRSPGDSA